MTLRQFPADLGFKAMNRAHRAIVALSGGRVLGSAFGMPVVEPHTAGRVSGRPRSTKLTAPVIDGDRVVLAASKGGDGRDPDWYRNLVAHPEIELTAAGRRRAMRARPASAQEKAELWPRVVAACKGYGGYQHRTRWRGRGGRTQVFRRSPTGHPSSRLRGPRRHAKATSPTEGPSACCEGSGGRMPVLPD